MRKISESLLELASIKSNINDAIVSKGGTSSTDMSTYATSIENIQTSLPTEQAWVTPMTEPQTLYPMERICI